MASFSTTSGARSGRPLDFPPSYRWTRSERRRGQVVSILQLVSGLVCAGFVVFAAIGVGLLVGDVTPWADGVLGVLACLHGTVFTGQFAEDGRWLPRRWNILFWLLLSLADLYAAVMLFGSGHGSNGVAATTLFLLCAAILRKVAQNRRFGIETRP